MDANIAIAQARGLRRVAADLDRVWDDYLKGDRTPADDNDAKFPAEFLGSMLAAPVVRALAAELALKAIAIKTTGDHKLGHDLLKLFDALDQKTQMAIEQKRKGVVERVVHGSVRSWGSQSGSLRPHGLRAGADFVNPQPDRHGRVRSRLGVVADLAC